jgi:hypothetical protein
VEKVLYCIVLLSDIGVNSLLFVLGDSTIVILAILAISGDPKAVCVVPQCLDERTFTGIHSLRSHICIPKLGPFIGEVSLEEVGPAYTGLCCGGIVYEGCVGRDVSYLRGW